jgi:tRNA-uridine 2-sulfurtransferase
MTRPRVYVGMSGGVDSSIAAALLLDQDYDVTGVYMKNWSQDLPGMQCPWAEDLADAKRVAVQLGIDFKVFDFETQYRQKVVDYMLDEYRAGRTPNPDIMCNQEVKFKLFLETSLAAAADYIASTPSRATLMSICPAPCEASVCK